MYLLVGYIDWLWMMHTLTLLLHTDYCIRPSISSLGARVLDMCCGSGIQTVAAATYASHVVAVDLNPRAVRFCAFRLENRIAVSLERWRHTACVIAACD